MDVGSCFHKCGALLGERNVNARDGQTRPVGSIDKMRNGEFQLRISVGAAEALLLRRSRFEQFRVKGQAQKLRGSNNYFFKLRIDPPSPGLRRDRHELYMSRNQLEFP